MSVIFFVLNADSRRYADALIAFIGRLYDHWYHALEGWTEIAGVDIDGGMRKGGHCRSGQ